MSSGCRLLAWFAVPALTVAGVLTVAWFISDAEGCGGPVPGCGTLQNVGEVPVTVRAESETGATPVESGDRVPLRGAHPAVWVDAGQCLTADGGPFWDARAVIDRTEEATGVWHPIDDWGARVQLRDDGCS